jgi:hypothetical protein
VSSVTLLPEFVRNGRIQLRPRRAVACALICAAISLACVGYFVFPNERSSPVTQDDGIRLMQFLLVLQIMVLVIGGGIYCLQSIHREKEQNTFDYQRITRLTPLQLAVGKLLGTPILPYFYVLCRLRFGLRISLTLGFQRSSKYMWLSWSERWPAMRSPF